MAVSLEVVVIDATESHADTLPSAIEMLNAVQGAIYFRAVSATAELLKVTRASEVLTTAVFAHLSASDRTIVFIEAPLCSPRLGNLFGSMDTKRTRAVVTTRDYQQYTTSAVAYCSYYLCRYAISFLVPALSNHRDTRSCFFDKKMQKQLEEIAAVRDGREN